MLEDIQAEYGYISEENMRKVEQDLKIPLVDIYGVVTFYSAFKLKPSGKHTIKVCTGTACHVKKSDSLKEHLMKALSVKEGETTSDGKFTLELVNCIGACAKSPAMMIDEKVYGELTAKKIDSILKEY